jgi:hypothetical protein
MKERCQDKSNPKGCRRNGEAFRDPAKPYSEQNYSAYCDPHGGDERARDEVRKKRASSSFAQIMRNHGVKPLPSKRGPK